MEIKEEKKVYSKPEVMNIGKMIRVTAGGPGSGTEANSHFDNNPNN